ncbi:MAG: ribonuclease P protein component [bacterium]|nr:ribonuclease P protein component [bacterium]
MIAKKFKLPIQLFPGKRGKLFKSPNFTLKVFPADLPFSRFGVTISAKTAPKAAKRNLLKRTLFNDFRIHGKDLPVADYWITILAPAVGLANGAFVEELKRLLNVASE